MVVRVKCESNWNVVSVFLLSCLWHLLLINFFVFCCSHRSFQDFLNSFSKSIDLPWGLRVLVRKINVCLSVLQLSELPRCRERLQTAICSLE